MTNLKKGASSVVRPENLIDTIKKLTSKVISDKFSFYLDRDDLFNEGFCSALEYVNEKPNERSVIALIYKRIFGAVTDYVNKNSSPVKITKNNQSRRCIFKNSEINAESSSEGELLVKNAKQSIELNNDIKDNFKDLAENAHDIIESYENKNLSFNLYGDIVKFVDMNFNKRDKQIFELRMLKNLKLKDVSNKMLVSKQRINKIEKNICNSLNLEFGNKFFSINCN